MVKYTLLSINYDCNYFNNDYRDVHNYVSNFKIFSGHGDSL